MFHLVSPGVFPYMGQPNRCYLFDFAWVAPRQIDKACQLRALTQKPSDKAEQCRLTHEQDYNQVGL